MTRKVLVWVLGSLLLGACGDDDDEPGIDGGTIDGGTIDGGGEPDAGQPDGGGDNLDCSEFVACGGDPTGVWTFEGACDFEGELDLCEAATVNSSSTDFVGTLALGDDASYAVDVTIVQHVNVTFPPSCAGKGFDACEDYAEGDENIECTGDFAVSCTCEGQTSLDANDDTGTWAVRGNLLSLTTGKTTDEAEFCVSGSQLRIREPGEPGIIVLRK